MKDKNKYYVLLLEPLTVFKARPSQLSLYLIVTSFTFSWRMCAFVFVYLYVYVCILHISVFVFVKMSGEICVKGGATMQLSRWQEAPEW